MTSFRFIHTADIHLDSPLKGLSGYEGPVADRIRSATRQAFDSLIGEAIDGQIDFMVIAGDLYDGDWRDYQTGLFFVRQMGRLAKANIPAFLLYGNHDAESQITKRLTLPDGVKAFSSRKSETFALKELGVAIHGQSFRQRDITEDLVPGYPEPVRGAFNIGVLHTGMGGMGGHLNYAPCALEELIAKGYDYWALGHVHNGSVLHKNPYVVFPGNLQGRHIRETGAKGAYLVSVEDGAVSELTQLQTDVVRWANIEVNLQGCNRDIDALEKMRQAIERAVSSDANGRLLACRIRLIGRTAIHETLIASNEKLLAEAKAAALGIGDDAAWIERVIVSTEPELDPAISSAREDAMGELQRMLTDASSDRELLSQLEGDIGELIRKLPSDVRDQIDDPCLEAAVRNDYPALIAEVRSYVNARLLEPED